MKITFSLIPILFLFLFIGIMPRSYAQTPKEIELPLAFARFIGIKVCDSYTISYFIKEDIEGKPVYNNGILVKKADKNKTFLNMRTYPLFDIKLDNDTLMIERISKIDSIYKKKGTEVVININESTSENGYTIYPKWKNYSIRDTIWNKTIHKSVQGVSTKNEKKGQIIEDDVIVTRYTYDVNQDLIKQDTIAFKSPFIKSYFGEDVKVNTYSNNTISFSYRLKRDETDVETTYLVSCTLDRNSNLQSFTIFRYHVSRSTIYEDSIFKIFHTEDYQFVGNAVFLCN